MSIDGAVFQNISANTPAFPLVGGCYAITAHATWGGGNIVLQRRASDGSTFVNVITAITADGYATANLSRGTYRIAVTTATAVYVDITSVAEVP